MSAIILTRDNFEEEVLRSQVPVVVDFSAGWCGPCQMMKPVLEAFAKEFEGTIKVGIIDVETQEDLAMVYGVMSVPTLKIFKNGRISAGGIGLHSREDLLEMLSE